MRIGVSDPTGISIEPSGRTPSATTAADLIAPSVSPHRGPTPGILGTPADAEQAIGAFADSGAERVVFQDWIAEDRQMIELLGSLARTYAGIETMRHVDESAPVQ